MDTYHKINLYSTAKLDNRLKGILSAVCVCINRAQVNAHLISVTERGIAMI